MTMQITALSAVAALTLGMIAALLMVGHI